MCLNNNTKKNYGSQLVCEYVEAKLVFQRLRSKMNFKIPCQNKDIFYILSKYSLDTSRQCRDKFILTRVILSFNFCTAYRYRCFH